MNPGAPQAQPIFQPVQLNILAALEIVTVRPLYARAAKDNIGSRRVLEKCGFAVVGEDKGYAHVRGEEIEEVVLRLD